MMAITSRTMECNGEPTIWYSFLFFLAWYSMDTEGGENVCVCKEVVKAGAIGRRGTLSSMAWRGEEWTREKGEIFVK
jgi:hypothetical protein